jgi:hypothetical protein
MPGEPRLASPALPTGHTDSSTGVATRPGTAGAGRRASADVVGTASSAMTHACLRAGHSGTSRSRESLSYLYDVVTREVDDESEFCRHHRYRTFTRDGDYVKRPIVEFDDISDGQISGLNVH